MLVINIPSTLGRGIQSRRYCPRGQTGGGGAALTGGYGPWEILT